MRAKSQGIKTHLFRALVMGLLFTGIFLYFTYAFFSGSFLITDQIENDLYTRPYTSGDIFSCFLGLVYGMFAIGMATPNFKAITEGRVAGKLAHDIISRQPKILIDDPMAKPVENL